MIWLIRKYSKHIFTLWSHCIHWATISIRILNTTGKQISTFPSTFFLPFRANFKLLLFNTPQAKLSYQERAEFFSSFMVSFLRYWPGFLWNGLKSGSYFNSFYSLLVSRFGTSHLPHRHKFQPHSPSEKGVVTKSRNMAGCSETSMAESSLSTFATDLHSKKYCYCLLHVTCPMPFFGHCFEFIFKLLLLTQFLMKISKNI